MLQFDSECHTCHESESEYLFEGVEIICYYCFAELSIEMAIDRGELEHIGIGPTVGIVHN